MREPDNSRVFRIRDRARAPRRSCTLHGELWALTAFYNPAHYGNKIENYRRFHEGLREAGVQLLTIEAAFGTDRFELRRSDADLLVQVRAKDVLWQKERLLNVALKHLPSSCDKVAWLDCDILLMNHDWPAEAARLLDRHPVAQLFSHCVRLTRDRVWVDPAGLAFGHREGQLFYGIAFGMRAHGVENLNRFTVAGHTGFAWAARRSLLESHGLYDANPLGGGDMDIAQALWGNSDYFTLYMRGPGARRHVRRWATSVHADVKGNVSYVPGLLLHLWHGDHKDRLYDRWKGILEDFDPFHDLTVDPATGLYRWNQVEEHLREWSAAYFQLRKEE